MTDFQRLSLDFAGLFLFSLAFVAAVHFRVNGMSASFLFFAAVAFFCSLVSTALLVNGYKHAGEFAVLACFIATAAAIALFIGLFIMAVA